MDEEIRQLMTSLHIEGFSDEEVPRQGSSVQLLHTCSFPKKWRFVLVATVLCALAGGFYFAISTRTESPRRVVHSYDIPQIALTMAPFIATTKTSWSLNNLCSTQMRASLSSNVFSDQFELMQACEARKKTLEELRCTVDHLLVTLINTPDALTKDSLSKAVIHFQETDVYLTKGIVDMVALKKRSCNREDAPHFEETLAISGLKMGLPDYQKMGEKIQTSRTTVDQLMAQLRNERDVFHLAARLTAALQYFDSAKSDVIIPMFMDLDNKRREALLIAQASFLRLVNDIPLTPWPRRSSAQERRGLAMLHSYFPAIDAECWARFDGFFKESNSTATTSVFISNQMGMEGLFSCSTRVLLPQEGFIADEVMSS